MIRLRASPVIIHIAAWLLFMSFPLLFMTQGSPLDHIAPPAIWSYLRFSGLYILLFYLHTNWLIPQYFLKKKYLTYSLVLILLFGAVYYIKPFDDLVSRNLPQHSGRNAPLKYERRLPPGSQFGPPPGRSGQGKPPGGPGPEDNVSHFDITSLFIFLMILGLGSALQSMKQWQLSERRAIRAEADKANAELSFLKAQINPHFLYNTLNNIYTLCITGSENAAESIMRLSNIMRYVTDESDADFVPLQDETECISNFIALQRLRLGKKTALNYRVEGDLQGHKITPLILMTFVENAFKYGLSNHLASGIDISLKADGQKIIFYSKNRIFEHKKPRARKGVGLENTKKRLNYLYPGRHTLTITEDEGFFTVLLVLESK